MTKGGAARAAGVYLGRGSRGLHIPTMAWRARGEGAAVPGPEDEPDWVALFMPLAFVLVVFVCIVLSPLIVGVVRCVRGPIALDDDGAADLGYEERMASRAAYQNARRHWLEHADETTARAQRRAEQWAHEHPPLDAPMTPAQYVAVQERGVHAWRFDPAYEADVGVQVTAHTEVVFLPNAPGMAPAEGGACSVQTNLPLPAQNEVYYWEVKLFVKPNTTNVAVGLATKPYPSFRFPGLSEYSVGYFSQDGGKSYNHPLHVQSYAAPYTQSDVVGVGYSPRTGTVFFTRNGHRVGEAYTGWRGHTLYPTIAADGAAELHVNLGQAGFVSIEANVRRWGLAPMAGTLAPPPAYGQDGGSILLDMPPPRATHRSRSPQAPSYAVAMAAAPETPASGGRFVPLVPLESPPAYS